MDLLIKATAVVAPIVAISVFALPSYIGVMWQRGFLRGLLIVLILSAYSVVFFTLIAKTGLPDGDLTYASALGYKLFGTTPWVLAFAYPPVLLVAFWAATKFTRTFARVILTAMFTTIIAVILEPATVKLQFWQWTNPGQFYGVPVLIFVSWALASFIGAWLLHGLWGEEYGVRAPVAYSGLVVVLFWTGVNAGVTQWIPFGLGATIGLALLSVLFLERSQIKKEEG